MGPQLIALAATLQWFVSLRLYLHLAAGPGPGRVSFIGTVSVLIPARNEAENLPRLLGSIPPDGPLEVIVIDDDSNDGTAEIARAHGADVVQSGGLPAGWIGKTWACSKGAEVARGDLLLFLDADCWFEPGGYEALLSRYPGGAFSAVPWHRVRHPYEQLSAFFNLTMVAANLGRALFGQCLIVGRDDYFKAGGHAAVKTRILETVAFGEVLRACGVPVDSGSGKGLISMRMYPGGLASLAAGWGKGFAKGAASVPLGRMLLISSFVGGLIMTVAAGCSLPWLFLLYPAYAALLAAMLRRVGNFSVLTALLYPVPLIFYHLVFFRALVMGSKNSTWKGRPVDAG